MKENKELFDIPEAVELLSNFKVTSVVEGRGHDGGGLICDLWMGNKKVATYHDDGWGGDPEIRFLSDDLEQKVKAALLDGGFEEMIKQSDWAFMAKNGNVHFDEQIEIAVITLVALKQMGRESKKAILVGRPNNFSAYFWKNPSSGARVPLKNVPFAHLQAKILELQSQMGKNERILNTKQQLDELGIKL